MPELALYLGGALACGLILGLLIGLAQRTQRESGLHTELTRQGQIIEALLNHIDHLSRRPLNLDGAPHNHERGGR